VRRLTDRCRPNTFDDMKDAVITVRLPRATRQRIEELARREGRSLSQQVERLIVGALEAGLVAGNGAPRQPNSLAGILRGGRVPTMADFKSVRRSLSRSLRGRFGQRDDGRRR
jgi:hypothetical protein